MVWVFFPNCCPLSMRLRETWRFAFVTEVITCRVSKRIVYRDMNFLCNFLCLGKSYCIKLYMWRHRRYGSFLSRYNSPFSWAISGDIAMLIWHLARKKPDNTSKVHKSNVQHTTQTNILWYGHWRPSLKYLQKKNQSDRPWYGHWYLGRKRLLKKWKKPRLWDCGVATGGPGQKPERKKMTRSVR